jgi:hypothetical protein
MVKYSRSDGSDGERMTKRARSDSSATDQTSRAHGSLDLLADSEWRGLRPIGASVRDVAFRTSKLFDVLMNAPNVWLFQAVCANSSDTQLIPHAICAGQRIILVDSVIWPPGNYSIVQPTGHVYCDGRYTGQSIAPFALAVVRWQQVLSGEHQVTGLVVVHPNGEGGVGLSGELPPSLDWTLAHDAVQDVRRLLPPETLDTSLEALAALQGASVPSTAEVAKETVAFPTQ